MITLTDVNESESKAVDIAITDDNGNAVTPSALSCVLYGADETDIIRTIELPLVSSQTINIAKADNTCIGYAIALRRLVIDFTYMDGSVAKGKAEEYQYKVNPITGR